MSSRNPAVLLAMIFTLCAVRPMQAQTTRPLPIAVKDLPIRKEMPDPLVFSDGRKVTTPAEWKQRREEMKKILEDYEYGHMPAAPGNVKGTQTAEQDVMNGAAKYRTVHLTFGKDDKLGMDLGIVTPAEKEGVKAPFPVLISLGFNAGPTSVNTARTALDRGYGYVTIPVNQVGADNRNYRNTGFFPAYPEYDWNDFSAWAWGISRAVDYLQNDPLVDKNKIIVTGTSRYGQAALLAGAFDERIAMTAPVAGGMALRFSGKDRGGGQGIEEVVAQNTYWFGPHLEEFRADTDRLPCDQHWLLALAAPRYYMLCNSLADQYGNPYAAALSFIHARPVYGFLGAADNIALNFRPGGHGMQAADWSAILDFADVKLMGKKIDRKFQEIPPDEELKKFWSTR